MKVIDHESAFWFLLQERDDYFLDVNCSLGHGSYGFLMQLDEIEKRNYIIEGKTYIDELAEKIAYSVPVMKESTSIYQDRNLAGLAISKKSHDVIIEWQKQLSTD